MAFSMLTVLPQQRFKNAWQPRGARTPILKSGRSLRLHSSAFLRPNRSRDAVSVSRAMRWATLAGGRTEAGTSTWLRRRLAAEGWPVARKTRNSSRRWLPLMVNEVKRLEK